MITPPGKPDVAKRLVAVLNEKGVEYDIKDVAAIINASYPDIRRALNAAQASVVNGKLQLDKASAIQANYMTEILEVLKNAKDKKEVEFALRTKISCDKNHVNGITTKGTIVSTVHGFIEDTPNAITKYKKDHSNEWLDILGKGEVKITEDNSDWEEKKDISDIVDFEETVGEGDEQ